VDVNATPIGRGIGQMAGGGEAGSVGSDWGAVRAAGREGGMAATTRTGAGARA
jgi:hypothetical protein